MNVAEPAELVQQAGIAQREWGSRPIRSRVEAMRTFRRSLSDERERLVQEICRETGKPPLDALAGDVLVTLEHMLYYERHSNRLLRRRRVGKPSFFYLGSKFYEQYEPYGVVLIYAPANYPLQLSMVPAITALFAGNSVLLKFSERTPGLAGLMESLAIKAGLPKGLLQIVHDEPSKAAAYIDAGPDLVFFTGSCENGRAVAKKAAEQYIPTVLELGGKDAAVVFADCNLERTIEGVLYGAFSNAGQVCVGIKRLYVERSIWNVFLQRLAVRVSELRVGTSHASDLGNLPEGRAKTMLVEQVSDAIARGAILEYPREDWSGVDTPILLRDVPANARLMTEESFGPVLCMAPFDSESEAIAAANLSEFALGASVWTSDMSRAKRVARALNSGTVAINDVIRNIGNPHTGFGGNKRSGHGRYHGPHGLYAFSRLKSVMVSNGRGRRQVNWFPFSEATYNGLDRLIGFRHSARRVFGWLHRMILVAVVSGLLGSSCMAQEAHQGHLRIRVTCPPDSHGAIAYLLFASSNGFPNNKQQAFRSSFTTAPGPDASITIDAGMIPPGRYAVTVYQDVNGNHKLDSGFLGIPKEPVGVSNNPKARFGPPRFDESAFDMGDSDKTISITLVHPK